MSEISRITLPSGTTYDLKDAQARSDIEAIQTAISGGITFVGETSTALSDGSTVSTIVINSKSVTAVKGNLAVYSSKEFVYDGSKWIEMGDLSLIGDLGWKDSASGSFTPSGSVAAPTISLKSAGSTTTVNSITSVGSLPSFSATVASEVLTLGWNAGQLPTKGENVTVKTGDAAYNASAPAFTGTTGTVTVT